MIYVFGHKPIDVSNCVKEFTSSIRDSSRASSAERLVLRCDVVYSQKVTEVAEGLYATLGLPIDYRESPLKAEPLPVRSMAESQRLVATDGAVEDVLLYIGPESLSLTNLLITHGPSEVLQRLLFHHGSGD